MFSAVLIQERALLAGPRAFRGFGQGLRPGASATWKVINSQRISPKSRTGLFEFEDCDAAHNVLIGRENERSRCGVDHTPHRLPSPWTVIGFPACTVRPA